MARLGDGGNLSGVDAATGGGGTCIPAGWWRFMISESDYKSSKAGDGMVLHLWLACLDPNYQGVEKRDFLSLQNPSQQATEIARSKLKAIALSVGHPNPDMVSDSDQLHQIPLMVLLDIEEHEKYGKQNRIKGYMSVKEHREKFGNGQAAVAPAAAPKPAPRDDEAPPHSDADVPF